MTLCSDKNEGGRAEKTPKKKERVRAREKSGGTAGKYKLHSVASLI